MHVPSQNIQGRLNGKSDVTRPDNTTVMISEAVA